MDNLDILTSMLGEHQAIRGHLKLLRDSLGDEESVLAWKLGNLRVALGYLEEGLKEHYTHEEDVMGELIGKPLVKAFVIEHRAVEERLTRAKTMLAGLDEKSLKESLTRGSEIKQLIREICGLVESHSIKEDTIYQLLRKALEK